MKRFISIVPLLVIMSVAVSVVASASQVLAQASYPMLMDVRPLAVQAGKTAEHVVSARYDLFGTFQVFVNGEGVTGEAVPEPALVETKPVETKPVVDPKMLAKDPKPAEGKPAEVKAVVDAKSAAAAEKKPEAAKPEPAKKKEQTKHKIRFTAAAGALPGVREFRLVTPQGLSTVGQLIVVRDPVVVESGTNNTQATANPVVLPATVCGAIEAAEDVDMFKFHVDAGKSYVFHVRSARYEDKIHDLQIHVDPLIALKNEAGVVLAANDNFFAGDPLLQYTFKNAGDYYLEVRDVRFQGNEYWQYSVEIHDRPLVVTTVPAVLKAGTKQSVELIGVQLPSGAKGELELPAGAADGPQWVRPKLAGVALDPVQVIATALAPTLENNYEKPTFAEAQDIAVPAMIAGRIAKQGEIDNFAFAAKKGQAFTFEVTARRAQSSLDSIIAIYDEKGTRLTESDDGQIHKMSYSDSILENWIAPADGKFIVEVRDLHLRGGEAFTYGLNVSRAEPYFTLHTDMDKVLIAGGVGAQMFVRVVRKNGFLGEIELKVEGLPAGVRAECGKILASGLDGSILFYAEPGTKPKAAPLRILGTGKHVPLPVKGEPVAANGPALTAVASPWQETYMPGGGRGHYPVDTLFVSVCNPLDVVKVTVEPTEVVLKPGESKKLEIAIERGAGFDKNLTLDLIYRHLASPFGDSLPKGVTIDEKQSKMLLTAKDTKGYITLTAAKDAPPVEKQLVPVMAQASINFVMKMSYCGAPLRVSVVGEAAK
ncbi:MAG: hypothetical protein K8U03_12360 [Planctomycetia bacterium]|nr:hypothetical protein [Planctomycetia bacterium]